MKVKTYQWKTLLQIEKIINSFNRKVIGFEIHSCYKGIMRTNSYNLIVKYEED